jgi:hypothetical protein
MFQWITDIPERINFMPDVKVPLIGNVPRTAVIMGAGAGVVVIGYLYYRHKQTAVTAAYGYGGSTAGYGQGYGTTGYYGYGFNYGTAGGSGYTPYPVGAEYGYGAYGYGYYNPYTGQWIGPTQQTPPTTTTPPKTISGFKSYPAGVKNFPKGGGWFNWKGRRYYYSKKGGTIGTEVGKKWVKTPV